MDGREQAERMGPVTQWTPPPRRGASPPEGPGFEGLPGREVDPAGAPWQALWDEIVDGPDVLGQYERQCW